MIRSISVWLLVSLLILTTAPLSTASDAIRTVALTGRAAPGASGANFSSFTIPILNNSGQTAFRGVLEGTGVSASNDDGIWSEGGGSGLSLVARAGNVAPDTSGALFTVFINVSPALNDAGQTAFISYLTGMGVDSYNRSGVWSEGGGSGLSLVAREGNAAPDPAGTTFREFQPFTEALNSAGQTAFIGEVVGPGGGRGIWSEGGGSGLAVVAREGSPAPGASGALFSRFRLESIPSHLEMNDSGQTAFWSRITGPGVTGSNNSGIWSEGGGAGLALVARRGSVAPSTSGALFSFFFDPSINNAGQTLFTGFLTGPGVNANNILGIWREGGGSGLELVARIGSVAPGTAGEIFSDFDYFPAFNDAGHTAFRGYFISGPTGIWSERGGNGLALVVRRGDVAPGTSGALLSVLDAPILNNAGQIAFSGRVSGAGVTGSNNEGIWAEDTNGVLKLIVRTGDLLDVDDGPGTDLRTISSFDFLTGTGLEDGRGGGFNDLGQLAFRATFTDGSSGVFVSDLVAVPEPSAFALLGLGVLSLVSRRRF